MHVDNDGLRLTTARMGFQDRLNRRKRIVEWTFHEDLAKHLNHQNLAPSRCRI